MEEKLEAYVLCMTKVAMPGNISTVEVTIVVSMLQRAGKT